VSTGQGGRLPRLGEGAGRHDRRGRTGARLYRESDGFFLGVSLIDHVTTDMDAYKDEIFGPVLEVMRADSYDEALEW
jgi:malonate-semialdehyde dehydrogenase (acetylating)/methylmalonate-semialdehyde dehydrogenase